jgi:hypothetical protein
MTTKRNVSLRDDLCAAAERKFGAEFQSVESLLEFVLQELLADGAEKLDQNEKAILEKRLRDLGYI